MLAPALADFAKHHNMPEFSAKRQSEIALAMAMASVYGRKITKAMFPANGAASQAVPVVDNVTQFQPHVVPTSGGNEWFGETGPH